MHQILGRNIENLSVSMLRALEYHPSGSIYFRTDITHNYELFLQAPAPIRLFSKFWKQYILGNHIDDLTVNMLQAWASESIYFRTKITDNYKFLPHRPNSANKYITIMEKKIPVGGLVIFLW